MKFKVKVLETYNGKGYQVGFAEQYTQRYYRNADDVRYTTYKVKFTADIQGNFSEPYVARGGIFVPAHVIHNEMGIDKYIKAKKVFYSVLDKDMCIVSATIYRNIDTGELIYDKSSFHLFIYDTHIIEYGNDLYINAFEMLAQNEMIDNWFRLIAEKFVNYGYTKEKFLMYRIPLIIE